MPLLFFSNSKAWLWYKNFKPAASALRAIVSKTAVKRSMSSVIDNDLDFVSNLNIPIGGTGATKYSKPADFTSAISLSAFDVWSVPTAQLTGTDTIGETLANVDDAVLDGIVEAEGSYTLKQAASILLSICAGKTTSNGLTFKTPNGNATRAVAVVNSANERTSMTLTP